LWRFLKKLKQVYLYLSYVAEMALDRVPFINDDYGGMEASDVLSLKELEEENRRLKPMYAELSLKSPCRRK
jgi:hypothetical protein